MNPGEPKAAEFVAREFGIKVDAHVRTIVHRDARKRGLTEGAGSRACYLTPPAHELLVSSDAKKGSRDGKKTRTR